jgi:hypothetical protein
MPDDMLDDFGVTFQSKYPGGGPPWKMAVHFEIDDAWLKGPTAEAEEKANAALGEVVARFQAGEEFKRCENLTSALDDIENRLAGANQEKAGVESEVQRHLSRGRDSSELDKKLVDLRGEVEFLAGRKNELAGYASEAKDAAEVTLRKMLLEARASLRAEWERKVKEAADRLSGDSGAALRQLVGDKLTFAKVISPSFGEEVIDRTLASTVKPEGLTVQRRQIAAWQRAEARQKAREATRGAAQPAGV